MQQQHIHQLKQIISNLENISQGQEIKPIEKLPVVQAKTLSYPPLVEFEQFETQFKESTSAINIEEIQAITDIVLAAFQDMKNILEYSFHAKKPSLEQLQNVQKEFISKVKKLNDIKSKDYQIHIKSILEGINGAFWVFADQAPFMVIDNTVESSEFHALKVKKLKIKEQTEWYNHFINAIKTLKPYIKQNFPTGLSYTPSGSANIEDLIVSIKESTSFSNNSQQQQVKQQAPVQQQSTPQPAQVKEESPVQELLDILTEFEKQAEIIGDSFISEVTQVSLTVLRHYQVVIFEDFKQYGKPSTEQQVEISQLINSKCEKIKNGNKDQTIIAKPFLEGLGIFFWIFSPTPIMIIDSIIESSEFHALKIKKLKIPDQTKWYNLFHSALKFLRTYVKANFPTGLTWNVASGSKDFAPLIQKLKSQHQENEIKPQQQQSAPIPPVLAPPPCPPLGGPGAPPPLIDLGLPEKPEFLPVDNKAQQQSADKSDLFNQINVGIDGIKAHLRKTDKTMLKAEIANREIPTKSQQQQKQEPVKQVESKQVQQKKEPKRFLNPMQGLYIENFVGGDLIEVDGVAEVLETKHCLFIDNCENCKIKVSPKINTIFITKCKKVSVQFNSLVSSFQIVNSKQIYLYSMERCPSIQVDKSDQIHISLMKDKETEIVSSNTSEINLTYPETEEEMAKETPIPNQFITKWDPQQKKFVTEILSLDL